MANGTTLKVFEVLVKHRYENIKYLTELVQSPMFSQVIQIKVSFNTADATANLI